MNELSRRADPYLTSNEKRSRLSSCSLICISVLFIAHPLSLSALPPGRYGSLSFGISDSPNNLLDIGTQRTRIGGNGGVEGTSNAFPLPITSENRGTRAQSSRQRGRSEIELSNLILCFCSSGRRRPSSQGERRRSLRRRKVSTLTLGQVSHLDILRAAQQRRSSLLNRNTSSLPEPPSSLTHAPMEKTDSVGRVGLLPWLFRPIDRSFSSLAFNYCIRSASGEQLSRCLKQFNLLRKKNLPFPRKAFSQADHQV